MCVFLVKSYGAKEDQAGIIKSEFIYETASFPQCHASTIVETGKGLVAAWFGGTREGKPDVGIWLARQVDGKWTPPVEVANGIQNDGTRHPSWNPVLFQPKDGPLMLFYKVGPLPSTWWGMLRTSSDCGVTWSDANRLPDGILGPIKNKPVQLASGDVLCPVSSETSEKSSKWRVHFERTSDLGKTWTKVEPAAVTTGPEMNAIQPSILVHRDGRLQAIGRSRNKRLFQTWSSDDGKTWSALTSIDVPNPNSGTDAVTLRDGRHLLVYNNTESGRSPINVAISRDGIEWQSILVLEDEPKAEFSYPAVIQTSDGLVHITYTWKRTRIKHVVIDPVRLVLQDIP
ncbi:MAG: exo-alpha-sialidase [Kiritimatiellae bacterium]|nr:exo-alpha-sialidase [Kiritimatiellia bacterium]MDD5520772.1 exo-alpha-sialidase [Kiritimatiellia bacterium]